MMNYYLRYKKELVPLVLFGASAVFAVLILIKATGFFVTLAKAENIVQKAAAQNNANAGAADEYIEDYKILANELKPNNLFVTPPSKQHPVKEISGIFGDEVLIGDKWYGVGDKVADAKVLAIGPTSARISWNGTVKIFHPIDARTYEAPRGTRTESSVAKTGGANLVVVGAGREQIYDSKDKKKATGGSSGDGKEGLKKVLDKMKQKWPGAFEQNRDKLKAIADRWSKMSDSQRENTVKWLKNPENYKKKPQKK